MKITVKPLEYEFNARQSATCIDLRVFDPISAWTHILGAMIFPENFKKRYSWITRVHLTRSAKKYSAEYENIEDSSYLFCLDVRDLAIANGGPLKLIENLFSSQSNAIVKEGSKRIKNGMLTASIYEYAKERKRGFEDAVEVFCEDSDNFIYAEGLDTKPPSKSYLLNTILPRYMPVVHFWWAYNFFCLHDGINTSLEVTDINELFNCKKLYRHGLDGGFNGFLDISDKILFAGIATELNYPGCNKFLLDITKMFFAYREITHSFEIDKLA